MFWKLFVVFVMSGMVGMGLMFYVELLLGSCGVLCEWVVGLISF